MRKLSQNGFSLIQLLIVVLLISVISTAFWNLHLHRMEATYEGYRSGKSESQVKMALDDIIYHIGLAGYDLESAKQPLKIIKGKKSDKLVIWHNEVCFEFFVDKSNKLIKKIENTEKIIAENVESFNTTAMNDNRIAVKISTVSTNDNDINKIETLSKSYSTIVEMRKLY